MSEDLKTRLFEWETMLKNARHASVAQELKTRPIRQVPRVLAARLSSVYRRLGRINDGLRTLTKIIRSGNKRALPSVEETSEYAILLARIGSMDEAMSLLSNIDPEIHPTVHFHLAYCHVIRWEHDLAADAYEKFLATRPEPYTALVSRVNF